MRKISRSTVVAGLLLATMASLLVYRASIETTITDESPHIVAGYAYNNLRDYRLNPEHPPLIKMIAALPLSFQNLNFPINDASWQNDVNGQWDAGNQFLHWSDNNPISITFWARVGPILITLLLGVIIFIWTRKLYGAYAGLFALTLFVFSPNFLAHGVFVATDVGATFAFLFATYFFIKYLQKQNNKNLLIAGIAFGIAQLMKFSLILLIPYFTLTAVLWVILKHRPLKLISFATVKRMVWYFGKLILIGIIGLIIIYPVYYYTTSGYPIEKQIHDTKTILENSPYPTLANAVSWMAEKPALRPYSEFLLGHLMVFQRVTGGNTLYFMGEVANNAWTNYFPIIFLLKVPTSFLLLIAIAIIIIWTGWYKQTKIALRIAKTFSERLKKFRHMLAQWGSEYFVELALLVFVAIYWLVSMLSNLNIGLRHVLPTFPFLYIILAGILANWTKRNTLLRNLNFFQQIKALVTYIFTRWFKIALITVLLLWYFLSSLSIYPHSLAYFNELAGGPRNGYKYAVDSNLDWGQDLRALAVFVKKNNIQNIKLDYFGTASPQYYLQDKYEPFNPLDTSQDKTGWIAVSATNLQNGRGKPVRNFPNATGYYSWLNKYDPTAVINYSIFVYHIE